MKQNQFWKLFLCRKTIFCVSNCIAEYYVYPVQKARLFTVCIHIYIYTYILWINYIYIFFLSILQFKMEGDLTLCFLCGKPSSDTCSYCLQGADLMNNQMQLNCEETVEPLLLCSGLSKVKWFNVVYVVQLLLVLY